MYAYTNIIHNAIPNSNTASSSLIQTDYALSVSFLSHPPFQGFDKSVCVAEGYQYPHNKNQMSNNDSIHYTRNKNCVYLLCLLLLLALPFIILVAVQSDSTATSKMFQVKLVVKNDKHPASKGSPRYHNGGQLTRRPSNEQHPSSRAQPSNQINSQKRSNMPTSSVCKFGPDY